MIVRFKIQRSLLRRDDKRPILGLINKLRCQGEVLKHFAISTLGEILIRWLFSLAYKDLSFVEMKKAHMGLIDKSRCQREVLKRFVISTLGEILTRWLFSLEYKDLSFVEWQRDLNKN